ncbi:glutamine amidotransferase-like class 1 domain-containing protein 3, mitochondrial isoform X3 [Struthio camelus]|uniref:glutamine amidotransferase-like class 1 domain-containing protein 3, mitochondrial isoform X3 n=1 Tax=Struthio camelus TaxID=8801 RepID=UPI00240225CC
MQSFSLRLSGLPYLLVDKNVDQSRRIRPGLAITLQCLNFSASEIDGRIAGCPIDDIARQTGALFFLIMYLAAPDQAILSGFGVAKNLCSWAVDGKNCTVNEHVNSTLQAFHSAKKPIGLCCISPVLAAKVFPGCEVTVGQDKNVDGRFPDVEIASAIAELGCKHVCKDVNESHVDKANKIVTTCAFMCKAPLHEIFDGIGTMIEEVLKLA